MESTPQEDDLIRSMLAESLGEGVAQCIEDVLGSGGDIERAFGELVPACVPPREYPFGMASISGSSLPPTASSLPAEPKTQSAQKEATAGTKRKRARKVSVVV